MDDTQERLSRALAGRYALEGQAGQGGMAAVYRATDLKHQRPVAIKVRRPELAATIGPERFLREIELSARLQHPHLVPLYDSGDAGAFNPWVTAPVRLELAWTMAHWPATREEGLRMLQYSFDTDLGSAPLLDYAPGRAYEAAGRRAEAVDAYGRFLRQWDKADSSAAPRVVQVREALTRLTGEPSR
jgi:hypothetical protein